MDIKYFEDIDYSGNDQFNYFVGTKHNGLHTSVHNACIVRKVISSGEKIVFLKLLSLMAVEFVRNNQYTVLPFPFKYLREYNLLDK